MRNAPPELSESEALATLRSYPPHALDVTQELLAFGRMLLDATNGRAASLDAKATAIVGYAGILLAFLVAHAADWPRALNGAQKWIAGTAAMAAMVAVVAGGWGMRGQRWSWFSERDWMRPDILKDAELQRRYYISITHKVHQRNERVNEGKATAVVVAQLSLAAGAALLALVLILQVACG